LPDHLSEYSGIGKCVYVNAFEFGYHEDPLSGGGLRDLGRDQFDALSREESAAIEDECRRLHVTLITASA
jgi:hypothetical protein